MKRKTNKKNIVAQTSIAEVAVADSMDQTNHDLMVAVMIVSLIVNLFILIAWVTIKVTSAYDAEVATFLFTR